VALFPRWGHLAPTCPDTIGCFPYFEQDPFILDTLPDVFIAGNQVCWKLLFLNTCQIFFAVSHLDPHPHLYPALSRVIAPSNSFGKMLVEKQFLASGLNHHPTIQDSLCFGSAMVSIRTSGFVVRIPGTVPVSDGYESAFPTRIRIQAKKSMLIEIQVRTKARIWNWRLHTISHFDYVWFFIKSRNPKQIRNIFLCGPFRYLFVIFLIFQFMFDVHFVLLFRRSSSRRRLKLTGSKFFWWRCLGFLKLREVLRTRLFTSLFKEVCRNVKS